MHDTCTTGVHIRTSECVPHVHHFCLVMQKCTTGVHIRTSKDLYTVQEEDIIITSIRREGQIL